MRDRIYYSREAERQARQQTLVLGLVVLIMGLGIGLILALLFAPRSGDETRKELTESAEKALEGGSGAFDGLRKDFDLAGVPIRFSLRGGKNPFDKDK